MRNKEIVLQLVKEIFVLGEIEPGTTTTDE